LTGERNGDIVSARQILIMFIMSTFSPAIRLFPAMCAQLGGRAGWLGPVIAAAALTLLAAALYAIFKNGAHGDLGDVFEAALGRAGGKIALGIYLAWTLLLYALYIRYYAERMTATIFPQTDIRFFIVLMLVLVCAAARGRLESFARFSEIAALIFTVVFAILFLFFIPSLKAENLLPLAPGDALPALKSSLPVISIWGYVTPFFFLGRHIRDKSEIRNHAGTAIVYLVAVTALMLASVAGSLGYRAIARMPAPFFSATKLIRVVPSFDRMEAILLSLWVVSDFTTILALTFIGMNIAKRLFGVDKARYFATPMILFGYAGGLGVASSGFELAEFSYGSASMAINIVTGTVFPPILLLILRLRRGKKRLSGKAPG
jgi:spore germination protein KB